MKMRAEKKKKIRKIDRKPLTAAEAKLEEIMLRDLKQRGVIK